MTANRDQVFHVTDAQAGQTLSALLRVWLPGSSWAEVRGLIERRRVRIDGNLCLDPVRRLRAREVVLLSAHSQKKPPDLVDVRLRYVDSQVVVVEKPPGITTVRHPAELAWSEARKQRQPTLDELLPRLLAREEQAAGRCGGARRGSRPLIRPVHRLDRDTSGLILFARTPEAERHLGRQFKQHSVHRVYQAIVRGVLPGPRSIASALVRDRGDGRRGSTTLPAVGKHAVTHVRPLESGPAYTLVECRLETGRTHQIRIHLSEIGHPLCGERVYDRPLFGPPWQDESGASRVALHAAELGFIHPHTEKPLRFAQPLPADLQRLWQRLRASPSSLTQQGPP